MAGMSTRLPDMLMRRNKKREDHETSGGERDQNKQTWMDTLEELSGRDLDGDGRIGKVESLNSIMHLVDKTV